MPSFPTSIAVALGCIVIVYLIEHLYTMYRVCKRDKFWNSITRFEPSETEDEYNETVDRR